MLRGMVEVDDRCGTWSAHAMTPTSGAAPVDHRGLSAELRSKSSHPPALAAERHSRRFASSPKGKVPCSASAASSASSAGGRATRAREDIRRTGRAAEPAQCVLVFGSLSPTPGMATRSTSGGRQKEPDTRWRDRGEVAPRDLAGGHHRVCPAAAEPRAAAAGSRRLDRDRVGLARQSLRLTRRYRGAPPVMSSPPTRARWFRGHRGTGRSSGHLGDRTSTCARQATLLERERRDVARGVDVRQARHRPSASTGTSRRGRAAGRGSAGPRAPART